MSVIVPLYNSVPVIDQLIDTLENQTFKDFEVVFIDDCSKDGTYEKIIACADKSSLKYKILKNETNKGPGISRNLCIEKAEGDYIFFIDSDDRIDSKTFEILSEIISQKSPDAILFDYYMSGNGKKIKCSTVPNQAEGFITAENAILYSSGATWCKVYKCDVVRKYSLKFPDLRIKEDFVFNKLTLSHCDTIFYVKKPLYEYIIHPGSIMNTARAFSEENSKKAFSIVEENIGQEYLNAVSVLKIKDYLFGLTQRAIRNNESTKTVKAFIDRYENENTDWFTVAKSHNFDKTTKVMLYLIKKRYIGLLRSLIKLKDKIKKHCLQ